MRKYGFNMLWMFTEHGGLSPAQPDYAELDFCAKHGFNCIRVPTDYNFWTKNYNYFQPDEAVFECIDQYIKACHERGLSFILNLHRAPGYCVNYMERERHNLWLDKEAQEAFRFIWETWANRYKGVKDICFDLLNEPPWPGTDGFTRDIHEKLMRDTIASIKAIDPAREIMLDGVGCGGTAIPELADSGAIHSGRGYEPFYVSHYKAEWCHIKEWGDAPVYPAVIDGKSWNREALREHYKPWRDVEALGTEIHIGEFGCYNKTDNVTALRWLGDLLGVFRENKWGYTLWNFSGDFGIRDHHRAGARIEMMDGLEIDRDLLELLKENRV